MKHYHGGQTRLSLAGLPNTPRCWPRLPGRARRLRPISREALLFGVHHQLLVLDGGGLLPSAQPFRRSARFAVTTDEVKAARNAAALLGRWFAAQGTQTSILQGMGIAP